MATAPDDRDAPLPVGPPKKHRHELGQEDHGSKLAAGTTRALQVVLGMWLVATGILVVWALVDVSRATADVRRPAIVTEPAHP